LFRKRTGTRRPREDYEAKMLHLIDLQTINEEKKAKVLDRYLELIEVKQNMSFLPDFPPI